MFLLVIGLIVVSLILVGLVVIQKGGSMGLSAYESTPNSVVGAAGILSKMTLFLIILFIVLVGAINQDIRSSKSQSVIMEEKK